MIIFLFPEIMNKQMNRQLNINSWWEKSLRLKDIKPLDHRKVHWLMPWYHHDPPWEKAIKFNFCWSPCFHPLPLPAENTSQLQWHRKRWCFSNSMKCCNATQKLSTDVSDENMMKSHKYVDWATNPPDCPKFLDFNSSIYIKLLSL